MNYNWAGSKQREQYERDFASPFVEHFFPFLLQTLGSHQIDPADARLLDIGCGFAPMAYAFVIYSSSLQKTSDGGVRYLGIDIRDDAVQWLQDAYRKYEFIRFLHHQADNKSDYVGAGNTVATDCASEGKTSATSSGEEAAYKIPEDFSYNLQWSSSVFTHLTPEACVTALQTINRCSRRPCVQVNTWFLIDEQSRYAMAAGIADRQLPIDCGKFLTFSAENPLLTTCYKIEAVEQIYDEAGLEIVEIDRGSWRGKAYNNRANHYQDVIVSVAK
ncbi:MAG: hypothetical protein MK171_00030 [Pirellulales bacterium]|nr:hypothetical protein [Pirellulales bacterium]